MFDFYTPWKRHKTSSFLTFSGSIEMKGWRQNGLIFLFSILIASNTFLIKEQGKIMVISNYNTDF